MKQLIRAEVVQLSTNEYIVRIVKQETGLFSKFKKPKVEFMSNTYYGTNRIDGDKTTWESAYYLEKYCIFSNKEKASDFANKFNTTFEALTNVGIK